MTPALCVLLVLSVYLSFATPTPDLNGKRPEHILAVSHMVLSTRVLPWSTRAAARREQLRGLTPCERARCWALFRIVLDVFRYAPERRDSLERVLRAYHADAMRDGPGGSG